MHEFTAKAVTCCDDRDLLVFNGTATGVPDAEASQRTVGPEVQIRLDLAAGDASATAWGCDLTEEYVRFNADYVT